MKKLVSFLLLASMAAMPVQANQTNVTFSQNTIDWNDHDALEALAQKAISHYEKSGSKAIMHTLFEHAYGIMPDYFGITILSALERFAFDYVKQNPNAIDTYIQAIKKISPKNAEFTVEEILLNLVDKLNKRAYEVGLIVSEDQLKVLAIFQLSMVHANYIENDFNLFKEIAEYAVQQIQ
jgi:Ni/Co efflux regulator RcnB